MNVALPQLPVRRADDGPTVVLGRETGSTYSYDCPRCGAEHRRGYAQLEPMQVLCQECRLATGLLANCAGCGTLLDPEEACCAACSCKHCGAPAVTCACDPSEDGDAESFARQHAAGAS